MAWFKAQGGIRDFKWRRWSNGAKSQDPKNPWTKNWPQKNPMPILKPLKVTERGNAIAQRKTLEIEHSCLFIHYTIWIYPFPRLLLFTSPKKIPTQIKLPKPNFRTQKKILESNFKPKIILRSSPWLEIPSTAPPPPLGLRLIWILHFPKPNYWYILQLAQPFSRLKRPSHYT